MDLIPILVFCLMLDKQPTNICTSVEDIRILYQTDEACANRVDELYKNEHVRQRLLRELNVKSTENVYFYKYCINRKDLDHFLYEFLGYPREDQDS